MAFKSCARTRHGPPTCFDAQSLAPVPLMISCKPNKIKKKTLPPHHTHAFSKKHLLENESVCIGGERPSITLPQHESNRVSVTSKEEILHICRISVFFFFFLLKFINFFHFFVDVFFFFFFFWL